MRIVFLILILLPFLSNGQKAFPSAYGGGSNATGGRNGILIVVNTLNSATALTGPLTNAQGETYYTGGLIAALNYNGAAYITFSLSGDIDIGAGGTGNVGVVHLRGLLNITDKTVFGQSAPLGGITITKGTFRLEEASNLIFRYFRSRPVFSKDGSTINGIDDGYTSAFLFQGADKVILDHVSGSFAHAKVTNFFGNGKPNLRNITISRSLFAEGQTTVQLGVNPGLDTGQCDNISFNYNLLGDASNRTPNMHYNGYGEVINNLIHAGSSRLSRVYYDLKFNHINNYYLNHENELLEMQHQEVGVGVIPKIYTVGNIYLSSKPGGSFLFGTPGEDNTIIWSESDGTTPLGPQYFTSTINTITVDNPTPIISATEAKATVLNDVGANKYLDDNGDVQQYIDPFDQKVINNVINDIREYGFTNWVLPVIPTNSRPSSYDTDNDGMADAWEVKEFGDLTQGYGGDFDGDGYENIEQYMNQVDGAAPPVPPKSGSLLKKKKFRLVN